MTLGHSGEMLARWVDSVSKTCHIEIDGNVCVVGAGEISYDQIFVLSQGKDCALRPGLSITYTTPRDGDSQRSGILSWGKSVPVESFMRFNTAFTGNA